MSELRFQWDHAKAIANRRKHSAEQSVFLDESALVIDDLDHSRAGERFLLVGVSTGLRTLTVSHCYRKADDVIRIISARKATRWHK